MILDPILILLIPIYILFIIQLDKIYPKHISKFLIYYAWALSFCNFLLVLITIFYQILNLNNITGFSSNIFDWIRLEKNLIDFYNQDILNNMTTFNIINGGIWIESGWLVVDWLFIIESYELLMLIIVTLISAMVQLYSINYMIYDDYKKFTTYITFFTFFMIILVTSGNFLVLFLGWEGVGLCSYLLINFWYTRINANLAAMKALIVNRIADMALTIGIILIFLTFLSLDFDIVFAIVPFLKNETIYILNYELHTVTLISLLIFVGAMGKSAQLGLHTWLPDAMEGPTPVSALIHAATMVTAGVFLLIKCSPFFELVPNMLVLILFIGSFTAFFSALIGLLQNDIKKIIAYSTCSQLGYMVFCCGLSAYDISFFHLINHAFFKALLFLSAGSLIHSFANEQDLRRYGISIINSKFIYLMFLIGSLALVGFPYMTGFYSKDLILEISYTKYTIFATFSYFIGIMTAYLTAIYSFKIIYLSFFFEKNIFRRFLNFDTSNFFYSPLIILALGSFGFGYLTKDLFVGVGSDFLSFNILIFPQNNNLLEAEFFGWVKNTSWWIKLIPFIIVQIALLTVILVAQNDNYVIQKTNILQIIISKKFFFDIFYNKIFVHNFLTFIAYEYIYKYFDKIILEILGPTSLSNFIYKFSYNLRKSHYGIIFIYAVYILIIISISLSIPIIYNSVFGIL
jgi:NADH-ubiquinone oxidoreductase chain 5